MPAPPSPPSVITAAKSEPSYPHDFHRYYVTGGESPEPEGHTQQRLRPCAQADQLRAIEERRDSAVSRDANRAGSAPAHPGSVSRKRPRAINPDEPVFRVKRKRGGARWSWIFTFKVDPDKLRSMENGERVAPPIVNEESDYSSEDEGVPWHASVDIDWHHKDDQNDEPKPPEPEPGDDEAEARPETEPEADTSRIASGRSKSLPSWDASSVSDRGRDAGEMHFFSPSEPDDSAAPAVRQIATKDKDATAGAEVPKDVEMADASVEDRQENDRPLAIVAPQAAPTQPDKRLHMHTLPGDAPDHEVKRPKERQTEFNILRGIVADALLKDPERKAAADIPHSSSRLAHLLEQTLYERCMRLGRPYEVQLRNLKSMLRLNHQAMQDLIHTRCSAHDVVRAAMEPLRRESSANEPILLDSPPQGTSPVAKKESAIESPMPAKKPTGLAEAQRRASDAAAGTNGSVSQSQSQSPAVPAANPVRPILSPNATPIQRLSAHQPSSSSRPLALVKPLVTLPRHGEVVGFRASIASPTARAFDETNVDDLTQPSGNPANFRPLSAAPAHGKFQVAPPNTHRCICQKQSPLHEAGQLIQCGRCKVMQHKICMGVPTILPRGHLYCCEQCRPDAHVETTKALQQGHRIWEIRANKFSHLQQQQQQRQQQQRVGSSPQVPAPPAAKNLQSRVTSSGHAHPEPRPPPPTLPSQSPSVQPQVVNFGNSLPSQHIKQASMPRVIPAPLYQTEMMSQELAHRILGDMLQLPMVQLILSAGSSWTEDQLLDLKAAIVKVPAGGHDLSILAKHLFKSRHASKQDIGVANKRQEAASTSDLDSLELDVEVNWNCGLDFNDSLPLPHAATAEEFFLSLEAEMPDEIRSGDQIIKEVRIKSLTELRCGPFSRIVRGRAADSGLLSMKKKLKSLEKDVEPELQFSIVWQDQSRNWSIGA